MGADTQDTVERLPMTQARIDELRPVLEKGTAKGINEHWRDRLLESFDEIARLREDLETVDNLAVEEVSRLEAERDAALEALEKALTWEGRLNQAEQLGMQRKAAEALMVRAHVNTERKEVVAFLARIQGETP